MAKGISINFLADVRDFLRGTKNVEDSLDDVASSLDDVAKEGDQSIEKLTDGFREAARAAKKSGDDVGDSMKSGFRKAEDGAQEFKDEANSTAREAAASFDGSAESIADAFQEVAANAFAGFGPAGAAAGLAIAAGLGLAINAITQQNELSAEAKQRLVELGKTAIESGADSAALELFNENLQNIVTNSDDATVKLDDLKKQTEKYTELEGDVGLMAMALAGNADAADLMIPKLKEMADELDQVDQRSSGAANATKKQADAFRDLAEKMGVQVEAVQELKDVEAAYLASGGAEINAKAAAISTINAAYDDAAGSVLDYVNAETGVLDVQAYIDSMTARQEALANYQASLAASGFTTEQKQALDAMGIDAASAFMAGYEKASPAQKEQMRKILTESAKDSSGQAKGVLEEAFKKPVSAKVQAEADTAKAEKDLVAFLNKPRSMTVTVIGKTREGKVVM